MNPTYVIVIATPLLVGCNPTSPDSTKSPDVGETRGTPIRETPTSDQSTSPDGNSDTSAASAGSSKLTEWLQTEEKLFSKAKLYDKRIKEGLVIAKSDVPQADVIEASLPELDADLDKLQAAVDAIQWELIPTRDKLTLTTEIRQLEQQIQMLTPRRDAAKSYAGKNGVLADYITLAIQRRERRIAALRAKL